MQCRLDEVGLGILRPVVNLDPEHPITGCRAQQSVVGVATEVGPRVHGDAAVGPGGGTDHLPRRGQVGEPRPRQELHVDAEAVSGVA